MHVDKRITLSAFKQQLEPFVGVPSSHFKVFRVYASNQEFESVRLNETLSSFSDDNKVIQNLFWGKKKHWYNIAKFKIITCYFLIVAGLNRCFNVDIVTKCNFDCNASSNKHSLYR